MRPIVKKAIAAVAVKEVVDRIQEARRPAKPSLLARAGKLSLYGGLLAGAIYLVRSGRLQALVERLRGGGHTEWPREGEMTIQRPPESTPEPSETPPEGAPAPTEPTGAPTA